MPTTRKGAHPRCVVPSGRAIRGDMGPQDAPSAERVEVQQWPACFLHRLLRGVESNSATSSRIAPVEQRQVMRQAGGRDSVSPPTAGEP